MKIWDLRNDQEKPVSFMLSDQAMVNMIFLLKKGLLQNFNL